jgi:hypothetical protein
VHIGFPLLISRAAGASARKVQTLLHNIKQGTWALELACHEVPGSSMLLPSKMDIHAGEH